MSRKVLQKFRVGIVQQSVHHTRLHVIDEVNEAIKKLKLK